MNTQLKTHTFHVHGMHCKACVILTESELREHAKVSHAVADLKTCCVEVHGEFGDQDREELAQELSALIERHGYRISTESEARKPKWSEFKTALPVAALFVIGFLLLQKAGLVNLLEGGSVTYGTAFVVGLIASLSTCMAVVGGLVLSISATFAKEGERFRPQLLFHIGRIISFFILGGLIGALGSAFTLGITGTFVLGLIIGLVMLVMGLNLLDVFPWTKKLQPGMPRILSKHALGVTKLNHTLTPLLVGLATFFLPCGFTQSMQIYTLSTGSFMTGGLTMLAFALGTLPVLALLSFSSFSIQKSSKSGIFFKTAGLVVIMFALYNIFSSFAAIGVLPPLFNL